MESSGLCPLCLASISTPVLAFGHALCISKRFLLITEWYFRTVYLFVYSVTCGWASGLLEFSFPVRQLWAFKYCIKYFRSFP